MTFVNLRTPGVLITERKMCVIVGGGLEFSYVALHQKKGQKKESYILPKHPKVNFGLLY